MEATTVESYQSPDFSTDNGISWMTDGSVANRFAERSSVNSLAPLHSAITTGFADTGNTIPLCACILHETKGNARERQIKVIYFRKIWISFLILNTTYLLRFPRFLPFFTFCPRHWRIFLWDIYHYVYKQLRVVVWLHIFMHLLSLIFVLGDLGNYLLKCDLRNVAQKHLPQSITYNKSLYLVTVCLMQNGNFNILIHT